MKNVNCLAKIISAEKLSGISMENVNHIRESVRLLSLTKGAVAKRDEICQANRILSASGESN